MRVLATKQAEDGFYSLAQVKHAHDITHGVEPHYGIIQDILLNGFRCRDRIPVKDLTPNQVQAIRSHLE
ncbi:MAG: hypothetical protein A3H72_01855 [Candidatus Doudnabacteria bacterium RIFCSPLOWO2_02_FULL_48_8]|uniref:Uncharacterized protein n=1 Tax=Candidatus Doudnabacteria bacterium RIFCSPHIGHO2_01_FULL_46_24 TaxID=1817825 RepID=A0A1F5NTY7_9BACT|nr:MAG: hypothetical protein A2720_01170 [Candidatus Doudnabacteria bacterium RIFCSPHIGHO2_01_FULL_46_24]OGE95193.1 MAG: hypothetical protein A3H72_01855 [Candidatus Doudnabacteria bacterium RIFCSPLOWO2_02_FULL_48_8]OGE96090.1 MAG: hypothetical protein A3E98_02490 [Candidatus Doudnabacteria bacterium RIFCSPHIGHO2_12_FULL_48_11]